MPSVSAVFLVLSLALALAIGSQARPWCWGPAMIALALAVTASLPSLWRRRDRGESTILLGLGIITAAWFVWRGMTSPVAELGKADLMLLAGSVGSFICLRGIREDLLAGKILIWGIALLLLVNVAIIARQVAEPSFTPIYYFKYGKFPTGLDLHYNEAANYLIASSMILAAAALFGSFATLSRILLAMTALAGLVGVYFTHSRGGILGAAIASIVLTVGTLIAAKRDGSKWFAPGLLAIPLIGITVAAFLLSGWEASQEIRQPGSGILGIFDNDVRLYLLGLAVSTVSLHPFLGGGSRSFSWESIRLWDSTDQGSAFAVPRYVHNEFIQSATDYGIIGALLLALLLGGIILAASISLLFGKFTPDSKPSRAWLIGGCAALAGMLVQSSFSFVFHFYPGVLLLGIALSLATPTMAAASGTLRRILQATLLSLAAILCLATLIPDGWSHSRVTGILWKSHISGISGFEDSVDQIGRALELYPSADLFMDRASRIQVAFDASDDKSPSLAEPAIRDYAAACQLNPYDPKPVVNQANLLSQMGSDAEAERLFAHGIVLQGGFEAGYHCHLSFANHYFRKGLRLFNRDHPAAAIAALENARTEIESAFHQTPYWTLRGEGYQLRLQLLENLALAREAAGDLKGALEAYESATQGPEGSGNSANFWVGQTLGKIAKAAWDSRESGHALWYFNEAKRRMLSVGSLPAGVSPSQHQEATLYFDRCIAFLTQARVQPVEPAN